MGHRARRWQSCGPSPLCSKLATSKCLLNLIENHTWVVLLIHSLIPQRRVTSPLGQAPSWVLRTKDRTGLAPVPKEWSLEGSQLSEWVPYSGGPMCDKSLLELKGTR